MAGRTGLRDLDSAQFRLGIIHACPSLASLRLARGNIVDLLASQVECVQSAFVE